MKIEMGWLAGLAVGVTLCLGSGCATTGEHTYKNATMNFGAVQKVAVLPFVNLSPDEDAAARVRDTFMGMLLATEAMYVLPPGEVERGIERAGLRKPTSPTAEQVQTLGKILGVDAVITGALREYGTVRSGQ
ncbi:MAG: DUF799 family lipoprotein, partial [Proteobacteria bacterium]|nr:DUF799 family lipoprotein [Pseudomonadota bacterium]